jgi:hypothetical protein
VKRQKQGIRALFKHLWSGYRRSNPRRIAFAVPISFFKSISMTFGDAGLIFEGLVKGGGCRNGTFCQGLPGVNPQRSNQSVLRRNLFWEMLFQKKPGTARDAGMRLLSWWV